MLRAFDFLEQAADVIQAETRSEGAEVARVHFKWCLPGRSLLADEPAPQRVVHDVPERAPGPPRQLFQFCCHVVIERQGRSHIMMLLARHRDVKNT